MSITAKEKKTSLKTALLPQLVQKKLLNLELKKPSEYPCFL